MRNEIAWPVDGAWTRLSKSAVATSLPCNGSPQHSQTVYCREGRCFRLAHSLVARWKNARIAFEIRDSFNTFTPNHALLFRRYQSVIVKPVCKHILLHFCCNVRGSKIYRPSMWPCGWRLVLHTKFLATSTSSSSSISPCLDPAPGHTWMRHKI